MEESSKRNTSKPLVLNDFFELSSLKKKKTDINFFCRFEKNSEVHTMIRARKMEAHHN